MLPWNLAADSVNTQSGSAYNLLDIPDSMKNIYFDSGQLYKTCIISGSTQ